MVSLSFWSVCQSQTRNSLPSGSSMLGAFSAQATVDELSLLAAEEAQAALAQSVLVGVIGAGQAHRPGCPR